MMTSLVEFRKPGLKVEFRTIDSYGGKILRGEVLPSPYYEVGTQMLKVKLDDGREMNILAGTIDWIKVAQNLKEKVAEVPVINRVKFTYSVEGFYIDTLSGVHFLGDFDVAKKYESKGNILKGVLDRAIRRPGEWVENT